MFSNQNRPPRSPTLKREGDPLDKRRRVGLGKTANPSKTERRPPLVARKIEPSSAIDGPLAEPSFSESLAFSKEEVESLLNERLKLKKYDIKGNFELVNEFNSRLKICIKYFLRKEEMHAETEERLLSALNASEKRVTDLDTEMLNKEVTLRKIIADLEQENALSKEKLEKEETEKLAAQEQYRKEHENRVCADNARTALSKELEKALQDIQIANLKAASEEENSKRAYEYNSGLQQYNDKLQAELTGCRDSLTKMANEKLTTVDNLTKLRTSRDALKGQLDLCEKTLVETQKKEERLRTELQQCREAHEKLLNQVQDLSSQLHNYALKASQSTIQLDSLTTKTKTLEETCSSQIQQISLLQNQLIAATSKLQVADLSSTELRMEYESQRDLVVSLKEQLADKERQVMEGELIRKKLHNDILELKGNIRVFCRVRPLLPEDGVGPDAAVLSYPTSTDALGRGIEVTQNGQTFPFTYDKVFAHDASQEDVFEEISQLVQSSLDGYKVCIFAYGQTGSGKTYTMMGRPENSDLKGLIPRSLEQIFESSKNLLARGWKYKMQASMLEIYNESIRDLLAPSRPNGVENVAASKQYTIKHDAQGNTHVSDLTVVEVCSVQEISSLLRQAAQSRSVGRTMMNEQSSRSHFVFTLRISGVNEATEQQVEGVLNLIDLAGSERLSKSGATGDRLKETQAINKSLSSLSDVIFSLAKKEDHVPFRNSKLTYLLQPCLGGNSKTLMFVNISPDSSSVGESLCSLRFAARVNTCEIGVARRY